MKYYILCFFFVILGFFYFSFCDACVALFIIYLICLAVHYEGTPVITTCAKLLRLCIQYDVEYLSRECIWSRVGRSTDFRSKVFSLDNLLAIPVEDMAIYICIYMYI